MGGALAELYRRTQTSPRLEARLPEDVGEGRIARIRTPQGVSLSEWEMRYHRDTPVEGAVGDELRLLFCLGEGVEWRSTAGKLLRVGPAQVCLCVGDGTAERLCYDAGRGYRFHQISFARAQAVRLLECYLPEGVVETLPEALNGQGFAMTGEMRRLLEGLAGPGGSGGLGLLHLECRAHELLALGLEQALGLDGHAGLRPDDLAVVQAVRARIDADAAGLPEIAALAREYAVSASKLSRDFRQAYGVSIHACAIEARLEEAARLLSAGRLTVGEVAEKVGYLKHSQFSEAFRKRFGVLPKDY